MKKAVSKKSLLASVLAIVLCLAMLVGTTFAWFTDTASSGVNRIASGTLDVLLYYKTLNTEGEWVDVETLPVGEDPQFFLDSAGNPIVWEPGAVSTVGFKVSNEGSLALKYALQMRDVGHNSLTIDGTAHDLTEVLKVAVLEGDLTLSRQEAIAATAGELQTFTDFKDIDALEAGQEKAFTVVVYWEPTGADNNFNANNGRQAFEPDGAASDPNQLYINIDIMLAATQATSESDSFGSLYDIDAAVDGIDLPAILNFTQSATGIAIAADQTVVAAEPITLANTGESVKVSVPGGVKTTNPEGNDGTLTLTVNEIDEATALANGITLAAADSALVAYDIEVAEVDAANTAPITVELFVGKNLIANAVWHNGEEMVADADGDLTLGEYTYNPDTGMLKFVTASFSTFAMDVENYIIEKGVVLGVIDPEAASELVIPSTANGYTVTEIGKSAFYFDSNVVTKVTLPDGLKKIGKNAFKKCRALAEVNLPASLTEISDYAFDQCNLTEVIIPAGVADIGEYAFRSNYALATLVIPEGVETIGAHAFREACITELVIPASVTYIGNFAFRDCKSMESLTFNCETVAGIPSFYASTCFKRMSNVNGPNATCFVYLKTQEILDSFVSQALLANIGAGDPNNMQYAPLP